MASNGKSKNKEKRVSSVCMENEEMGEERVPSSSSKSEAEVDDWLTKLEEIS